MGLLSGLAGRRLSGPLGVSRAGRRAAAEDRRRSAALGSTADEVSDGAGGGSAPDHGTAASAAGPGAGDGDRSDALGVRVATNEVGYCNNYHRQIRWVYNI